MPKDSEDSPPPDSAQLPPDRCPNCGGPLKFTDGESEGLCTACGIYVEILRPLRPGVTPPPHPSAGDVAKRRDAALFHLNLSDMLDMSEDESPEAAKSPAPTPAPEDRSTPEAVSDHARTETAVSKEPLPVEPESQTREWGGTRAARGPAKPPLVAAKIMRANKEALTDLATAYGLETGGTKAQLRARLTAEIDRLSAENMSARTEPARPEGRVAEGTPEVPILEPAPAPEAVAPEPAKPKDGTLTLAPPPEVVTREPPPENPPTTEAAAKGTSRGAGLQLAERPPEPEAAPEEMEWGEWFVEGEALEPEPPEDEVQISQVGAGPPEASTDSAGALDAAMAVSRARVRRDRAMFYVGVVCAAVGSFGFGLGSFLHDFFRVPLVGRTYTAFGSLNVVATLFGGIVVLVGVVAIAISLRGGVIRPATVARA